MWQVRFVCIVTLGVVHIFCTTLLIRRPNMMAFRVGGALECLQEQYFLLNLCFSMVTFDLQAQVHARSPFVFYSGNFWHFTHVALHVVLHVLLVICFFSLVFSVQQWGEFVFNRADERLRDVVLLVWPFQLCLCALILTTSLAATGANNIIVGVGVFWAILTTVVGAVAVRPFYTSSGHTRESQATINQKGQET